MLQYLVKIIVIDFDLIVWRGVIALGRKVPILLLMSVSSGLS